MAFGLEQSRWDGMKVVGAVAIAAIALAEIVNLQRLRLNQPSLWVENPEQAIAQEQVRLQLLKQTPSFGFDNLLADWVFLNFLQYYGDEAARKKTSYGLSPAYFDIITSRDPRFTQAYLFLSGSVSHQLGKPELAISMMQRGTAALSPQIDGSAFQVWRLKALDQLLLLGDIPGAINSFEQAADWTRGTEYASVEPVLRSTADFLRTDPNSVPVRVAAWASVYEQAVALGDRQTEARAKQEILAMGGRFLEKNGNVIIVPPPATANRPKS
jgi:hypothetical protein